MSQNLNNLTNIIAKCLEEDGNPEAIAQAIHDAGYRKAAPAEIENVHTREELVGWMESNGWKKLGTGTNGEMYEKDWRVGVLFGIQRGEQEWLDTIERINGTKP